MKILCITDKTFKDIQASYQVFCRWVSGRLTRRSPHLEPLKEKFLVQKQPIVNKRHFLAYEPSNAIYVNTCDYRRWCRVKEWFNQYGPDVEISKEIMLIQ